MEIHNSKILDSSIKFIKSVGPKRADIFANANLRTIKDLIFYFPSKYLDRTNLLNSVQAYKYVVDGYDGEITIIGRVIDKEKKFVKGGKEILIVTFKDLKGFFECVWFQGVKFYYDKFKEEDLFAISAKPNVSKYGHLQFIHPDLDRISDDESQVFYNTGKIIPFYSIPQVLRLKNIGDISLRKMISFAIDNYISAVDETLTENIISQNKLMPIQDAIKNMHFPESYEKLNEAKQRFKFEELFYLELLVALRKNNYKEELMGNSFPIKTKLISNFLKTLPFQLTQAQLKVLSEIRKDMENSKPMNRLLQGDVGSGKTIVALIAMLIAIDNGFQAAMMAPTEILAGQHTKTIIKFLQLYDEKYPERKIKVSLLIGGQSKSVRETQLEQIEMQEADIIIGTHALLEEKVSFKNLGLIIVDEQHRFGVVQRAKLVSKGGDPSLREKMPDVIVMSATPIPRTLTMTLYGDLDVSTINEMPKNRIPIKTSLRGESKIPNIYKFIIDKIKDGYQSFIVYPLVEESEKLELKAATKYYEELKETYFKDINVGLIHGRMKWSEKDEVMLQFAQKKFDVLISTTVIEVGIDIPNANIILINDAHRFGLSQLHQLRGRVGRSNKQAYCILVTKDELIASSTRLNDNIEYLSPMQLEKYKSAVRLKAMVKYTNGFKIAEIDVKLRGPGDIFGIKQSGFPELKYADLTTDSDILLDARRDAFNIIKIDPHIHNPQHSIIKKNLLEHFSANLKYAQIA